MLGLLLKHGPITAADLGERLGLSAAGVRRHLDNLLTEELAETVERRPSGRGRPAKYFRLTEAGRNRFGHGYDELATQALDALREAGGSDAVRHFARARIEQVVADVESTLDNDGCIEKTTAQIAEALDEHGYAVTVTRAGNGIQICQHHCPVASVAAEHPELCQAEHEVIASKLGLHIQPLATITQGHGICTTNIPLQPAGEEESNPDTPRTTPDERSDT
ncbi:helix-turn-helix transcriptional regulator [Corynebacterium tapiri]|uniref:helix-turn-helix transcriptional regulator n=1 Tax=Corynebacterium tapiri TaxID=1448266 RepID=UPI003CCC706B